MTNILSPYPKQERSDYMKQFKIHKSIMKYLIDKDLSLNAKGFLSIVVNGNIRM